MASGPSAIIVGAGVFGAATARALAGRGWDTTLVEQVAAGHVRSSSGGESRLIRCAHGADRHYTRWARAALDGWREVEEESARRLLVRCGLVWFARRDGGWEADSLAALAAEGVPVQRLTGEEAAGLFPDLRHDDLAFALYEPRAGVLHARAAVGVLVTLALARGARLRYGVAVPDGEGVRLDGRRLDADRVVWACGAWLPRLFGDLDGVRALRVTKQDVTFFGAPAAWRTPPTPGWVDYDAAVYGLGDLDGRGFKCAPDVEGEPFDPDTGPRVLSGANERRARAYLAHRFPSLAHAPLVGARTCQYTLTADTEFVLAPHPRHGRVWLAGGGSGHGFKHGPVIGSYLADLLDGSRAPEARFGLGHREPARALRTAGSDPT